MLYSSRREAASIEASDPTTLIVTDRQESPENCVSAVCHVGQYGGECNSEKAMPPLRVRASVEVSTTVPAKVATGLVRGGAAPARLTRTTKSRPTRARTTRIRRCTPPWMDTGHKAGSLDESAAPRKLG